MPSKEKNEAKKILWIKAKKDLDLVRGACSFDTYSKELLILKKNGKNILFLLGEELDDTTIAYYVENPASGRVIAYSASSEGERISYISRPMTEQLNLHYINILPIDSFPFDESKKADVIKVGINESDSLIRSIIKKAIEKEEIERAYIFESKGKKFIGVFDLFEELTNSKKVFYYAELSSYAESAFIRYNYSSDKIEFTNEFGEHSYLYIKLVNLAEPFPFFSVQ